MFLNQAQAMAFSGFMDGQVGPDPEYGTCLQCAAVDRARLKTKPVTPRSDICSTCFKKYCYDPENPPPEGQIVGRRFKFKDPDPFFQSFYENNKSAVTVGAVFGGLALLASIVGCVMFWRKRSQRKKAMSVAYQRVSKQGDWEWSAFMGLQGYEMAPPHDTPPDYDQPNAHYTEPSYAPAKAYHAEPNYNMGKPFDAMSDTTAYDTDPSYMTAGLHSAEPSYGSGPARGAAPNHETARLHHSEPS